MKFYRGLKVSFMVVSGAAASCNHVIDVQFYIENPQPEALNVRYYSKKTYDSVDYVIEAGERWHIDGRRVPLPRKTTAMASFERDRRFVFGRIWSLNLHLLKDINRQDFWKMENPAPDRFVYTLVLDSTVLGP